MINFLVVDKIIKDALVEDIPGEDISTNSVISENSNSTIDLICKEEGIIAGLKVFEIVFKILGNVEVTLLKNDGDKIYPGDKIALIKGNTRFILQGERVALNLLQRMSGIATLTNKYVKEIEHTNAKLLDTRKTTPNLKILEKYSVKIGGGHNHRFNLSDGVMLKDNHIAAAGGITNAVKLCRENSSFVRKIEVETETLDMVKEAIEAKASPLKPKEYRSYKSSIFFILLVACLKNDLSTSLDKIPLPLSVILICFFPPSTMSITICVAPASMEFSINSLVTEEGLSTTSPAAILFIVKSSNIFIFFDIIFLQRIILSHSVGS